jgi:hypothetical protein
VNGGDVFPKVLERKDGDSTCFICQRNPAEGHIRRYDVTVCRGCWDINWVGWPREHEARIIEHLKQATGAGAECVEAVPATVELHSTLAPSKPRRLIAHGICDGFPPLVAAILVRRDSGHARDCL